MKKIVAALLFAALLLGLCSCSTFKDTPETDAAFAAYEAAIRQSIAHRSGSITVVTETEDQVVNQTNSLGVIEYSFTVNEENQVSFERNDYTNGDLVASYYGDGAAAYQLNFETGEWTDVTESSKEMLNPDTNYMNTLSLFRIDHEFRYSKRFLESVAMTDTVEGGKQVAFTLKPSAVSDILAASDEKGIRRTMANQSRTYSISATGDVTEIVINTLQNVTYQGNSGMLSTVITVHLDY